MSFLDTVKSAVGKAKDTVDHQVDKHSDKIPDKVGQAYGRVSGAADKVVPGTHSVPEHEKLIKDD